MTQMMKILTAAAVALLVFGAGMAAASSNDQFEPDQRLSKGWFGVLTYKFIRDEVPGGQAALDQCDTTPRFSDLADQSAFKSDALHCLASLGYFDEVPLSDGGLPGWGSQTAAGADQTPTTTTTHTTHGDWEYFSGTFSGLYPNPYNGISLTERTEVWDYSSSYGDDYASLVVRCSGGETDFFIAWDGLVFGDSDDRVTLKYRIDDDTSVRSATAYEGASSDATFIYSPLPRVLREAETITFQVYHWYDDGPEKGATFSVAGYERAVQQLSNCEAGTT